MATTEEPWTIGRLLTWTVDYLGKHGAENPRLDAEVLLAHARSCKRIDLYAAYGETASDDLRAKFRDLVKRRAEGTPVAYLVGHREFYSLDFEVTPDVLVPRPETELLVVALLDLAKKRGAGGWGLGAGKKQVCESQGNRIDGNESKPQLSSDVATENLQPPAPSPQPLRIVDVGTGSGILAICAAKYLPAAQVTAIDISPAALAVARRNAEKHGVASRIEFVEGNLLASIPAEPTFDIVVSNPPYISTAEMAQLARDVRDHEPHLALHGGEAGTEIVAQLVAQAAERLMPGGTLLIEISPMIAAAVEQVVGQQSSLVLGPTAKDLAGHPRVIQAMRKAI